MNNKIYFPFSNITGQDKAKLALILALVNEKISGVILFGATGTGKSTLLRSLSEIASVELINIPLNITDDMLLGGIDIETTIKAGSKVLSKSLLERAKHNIIYIDDINLLRTETVRILQGSSAGDNINNYGYTVLAGANQQEGDLNLNILDKFGLSVSLNDIFTEEERTEIIKNNLKFEDDPQKFRAVAQGELEKIKQEIVCGKNILPKVEISSQILELIAVYCHKANCCGHRAEIYMMEASKAFAALQQRTYVLPIDIEVVAELVLAHRVRQEQSNDDNSKNNDNTDNAEQPHSNDEPEQESPPEDDDLEEPTEEIESNEQSVEDNNDQGDNAENNSSDSQGSGQEGVAPENIAEIDKSFAGISIKVEELLQQNQTKSGVGKRSYTKTNLKQGRYVRACFKEVVNDLAFDATIRAAAPYQKIRKSERTLFVIEKSDLRQKIREKRIGKTFIFVVDASGSMGVKMRMKAVKGAIFSLLNDVYQKRDQVGLIAFRRETAEVVLPVTRSVDLAQKVLENLPTGGKTPLVEGLSKTYDLIKKIQLNRSELEPIVVLITDGRANNHKNNQNFTNVLEGAEKLGQLSIKSVVIDTENDYIKFGFAKSIASAMSASYYHFQQLSQQNILHIIKNQA